MSTVVCGRVPGRAGYPSEFGQLLLASFLLSFAVVISHGRYFEPALACIVVAFALLVSCFAASVRATPSAAVPRPAFALIGAAIMQLTALLDPKLIVYPHTPVSGVRAVEILSILLLTTYLPFLGTRREPHVVRTVRFAAFGALTLAGGLATIHISPAPLIDVWDVQMRGAHALLRGENPYVAVTAATTSAEWGALGFSSVPYVYSPGSLYVGLLGLAVGRDVRYAMLLATIVTGVTLRSIARPAHRGEASTLASFLEDAPALFVWLMGPLFFILEQAWIDPIQLVLVCAAVATYLASRPALAAAMIGLALASKQSMFWLIPISGVVLRFRPREWVAMIATWGVLVVPFVVADFHALKHATYDALIALPGRSDALSATVWFQRTLGWALPTGAVASFFAAAAVGASAMITRALARRGNDGIHERASLFVRATAVTYLAFFLFSKIAFANYYFLIAGLAALAAATCLHERSAGDGALQ